MLNTKGSNLSFIRYSEKDRDRAMEDYLRAEKLAEINGYEQIVLASSDSIKNLKRAYPNYFIDTQLFLKELKKI
jgi:putative GTP pyrophosphokinase